MASIKFIECGRDPSSIPVHPGQPLATMEAVTGCLGVFGTVTTEPEKPYSARVAVVSSQQDLQVVGKARLYQDENGFFIEFRRRSGDGVERANMARPSEDPPHPALDTRVGSPRGVLFATIFRQLERSLAPFVAEEAAPNLPPGWSEGPDKSVYKTWPLTDVISFEDGRV